MFHILTFESMNLLIVAKMSWWPDTSSRVSGLYFSTLAADCQLWSGIL